MAEPELLDPLELLEPPEVLDPPELLDPLELEEPPELFDPGMVRRWPIRIMALEPRLLAEMIALTDVLCFRANDHTVSPARTVCVVESALLDEPDPPLLEVEAVVVLAPPMRNTWPTRMAADVLRSFWEMMRATVVP
ncbi:MAG TPA: hypothetical protein VK063_00200 [Beutenbergiaceae bacterium]|nr:hypothetical protein [Beutenbergiaceae bacterium]